MPLVSYASGRKSKPERPKPLITPIAQPRPSKRATEKAPDTISMTSMEVSNHGNRVLAQPGNHGYIHIYDQYCNHSKHIVFDN